MTSLPKNFSSKSEIHCELLFFSPNISSSQKCNPGHVKCSLQTVLKNCRERPLFFFGSISKLSIEFHKRRPSLKMFLWNYRVLIWQYYQKFRHRSDIYAECLETTIKLFTFHKNFLSVHVWMTLKHFWIWAKNVCLKGPKFFCSKSEISYENFFLDN